MVGFLLRKYRVAFIAPLVATCFISVIIRVIINNDEVTIAPFGGLTFRDIAFKLNFENFDARVLYMVPLLLFHHLCDVIGTSLMLIRLAYFSGSIFR